jgi:hypothetical protein
MKTQRYEKETTVAQADPKTEGLEIQLDGWIETVP